MRTTFFKTLLAVAGFAVLHSLLASWAAKQHAAAWFGARSRNGLYRFFFNFQSVLSLGGLLLYLRRLPDQTLYTLRSPLAALFRLGQASGWVLALLAAGQVGYSRITGIASLLAWLRGERRIAPEPEAQGPALDRFLPRASSSRAFMITRHPLNLSPLPIFWFTPQMTVKRLAFNLASTIYLLLGSIHEEKRLENAYGRSYRRYQRSGIPFYLPFR